MQQRYYDPQIGRFLSVAPIGAYTKKGVLFNRYWYANNNPYKFLDPDGRYICKAGKENCTTVSDGLADAKKAMEALPEGSKERAQIGEILTTYGTEGVDNGVTVVAGKAKGGAGQAETKDGKTTITINFKGIAGITGGAGTSIYKAYVRNTVIHEGTHGADQLKVGMPTNLRMLKSTEKRASRAEAHVARGLGEDHTQGYWTKSGRYDEKEISNAVQESVDKACSEGGC